MKFIHQIKDFQNIFSLTFDVTSTFALKSGISDSTILPHSNTMVIHICHLLSTKTIPQCPPKILCMCSALFSEQRVVVPVNSIT
jgi:hypothetical protein